LVDRIDVRKDANCVFFHLFSQDKKFVPVPAEAETTLNYVSCICELVAVNENGQSNYASLIVRVNERVLIQQVQELEYEGTNPQNQNVNNQEVNNNVNENNVNENNVNENNAQEVNNQPGSENKPKLKVKIAQGTLYLDDSNQALTEEITNAYGVLEKFLSAKMTFLVQNSQASAQVVMSKMALPPQNNAQQMSLDSISSFTLMLGGLLRIEPQVKRRILTTKSLTERMEILKGVAKSFEDIWEVTILFDIDVPGSKLHGNVFASIMLFLVLFLAMIFFYRK